MRRHQHCSDSPEPPGGCSRGASRIPETATKIANTLAKNFIEQNLDQKVNSSFQSDDLAAGAGRHRQKQRRAFRSGFARYIKEFNQVSLEEGRKHCPAIASQAQTELSKVRAESAQAQQAVLEIERLVNDGHGIDTFPPWLRTRSSRKSANRSISRMQPRRAAEAYRDKYPAVVAGARERPGHWGKP